jgi:hypothetical protein
MRFSDIAQLLSSLEFIPDFLFRKPKSSAYNVHKETLLAVPAFRRCRRNTAAPRSLRALAKSVSSSRKR